jgi:hypothetical protein
MVSESLGRPGGRHGQGSGVSPECRGNGLGGRRRLRPLHSLDQSNQLTAIQVPGEVDRSGNSYMLGGAITAMLSTQNLCRTPLKDLPHDQVPRLMNFISPGCWTMGHFLMHMLFVTRMSDATDGRDKVFGLHGIMNAIADTNNLPRLDINVDYSPQSTISSVVTTATRIVLEQCNHLGYLTYAGDAYRTVKGLPSWVPDLMIARPLSTLQARSFVRGFKGNPPPTIGSLGFRVLDKTLHVHASLVGHVSDVSEPCNEMIHHGKFEICARLLLKSQACYNPTGQNIVEVLWRTLLYDLDAVHDTARSELGISLPLLGCVESHPWHGL